MSSILLIHLYIVILNEVKNPVFRLLLNRGANPAERKQCPPQNCCCIAPPAQNPMLRRVGWPLASPQALYPSTSQRTPSSSPIQSPVPPVACPASDRETLPSPTAASFRRLFLHIAAFARRHILLADHPPRPTAALHSHPATSPTHHHTQQGRYSPLPKGCSPGNPHNPASAVEPYSNPQVQLPHGPKSEP